MSYLPILLGALTAFCWGTSDYLSRSSSLKVGSYRTTVYMHVVSIATLLVLLPILNPALNLSTTNTLVLFIVGAVNFFAFIFLYRGFHRGVVSVVAPIAYSYPAITTVLAVLLLGTMLTSMSILALLAIMIGVALVSTRFSELHRYAQGRGLLKLTPGVGSAVLSASSFGAVYVGIGYVTPFVGYFVPPLFLRVLGGLFGFLFAPILKQNVKPDRHSINLVIVVMGVLETIGLLSFNLGISFGSSSLPIVAALSGMGGAFAISYAMFFLREKLEANQIIGILLSLTGVFVLLYFTS
ncbi:MAG: DMT family transporter [Thaumarchaeota archaeon]|nr:DMT family transporter [Nitrososphaerota archaeon]